LSLNTMSNTPSAEQPLAGVQIVELSTMVTCSLAAMTLRSQGAQVIKVEPVRGGDPMRKLGSQKHGTSALFHNCNRGKRSLAINLKHKMGVEAVKRLATRADVFLNNYRPGVMTQLGLGSDTLRALNPRLINVAVTGFGTRGPLRDRPAYDHVIQGIAGITGLQGGDDEFAFVRMLMCDKVTAYTTAQAVTAALLARHSTGEGQHIDISMLHACLAFMWPDGMMHRTLHDSDALQMPPISESYQTIQGSDGAVAASILMDQHWEAVLTLVGREELRSDPRFATVASRFMHLGEFSSVLKDGMRHLTVDEIMSAFEAADIPSAPCESRDSVSKNAQVEALGLLETYVTENLGLLTSPAPPIQFAGIDSSLAEPSPSLGEHSIEVMTELGFTEGQVGELLESGKLATA
jgi:crotonobetainyl-CoA:carnitine CoA-transferase CaiB-like acyl-CoA transferase